MSKFKKITHPDQLLTRRKLRGVPSIPYNNNSTNFPELLRLGVINRAEYVLWFYERHPADFATVPFDELRKAISEWRRVISELRAEADSRFWRTFANDRYYRKFPGFEAAMSPAHIKVFGTGKPDPLAALHGYSILDEGIIIAWHRVGDSEEFRERTRRPEYQIDMEFLRRLPTLSASTREELEEARSIRAMYLHLGFPPDAIRHITTAAEIMKCLGYYPLRGGSRRKSAPRMEP